MNDHHITATPSYYLASATKQPSTQRLHGTTRAEVCIIGGGYTGLSAALYLAKRGFDVALLEAARIGHGASGRNGGQLGTGLRKDQLELEALCGRDWARRLWQLSEQAKELVRAHVRDYAIDCAMKPGLLHASLKPRYLPSYRHLAHHLREQYGYEAIRFVARDEMATMLGTTRYCGGTLDIGGGHLHPLNYALGLAHAAISHGARIYSGSAVLKYGGRGPVRVHTASGEIHAEAVVLACNGYLGRLEPRIAGYMMPINNFIIATEPLGKTRARELIRDDVAVADSKFVVDYFRLAADNRLLFGGGETYRARFPRDIAGLVQKAMLHVFPQLAHVHIDYAWGGTLAVTMNRLPHFGRLGGNIYYAHGFSGQGLALATLAGTLLGEAVTGDLERFDVFARLPMPKFPGGALLRWPGLVLGMLYYGLRDRL